ncbi:hypothetical protein FOXG_08837 [Fusarium oxysporum f. sp. lycopersici 4287]|uniref:Uncharacterized protein n=1 Tax=Fusarium oxysporum f. sp. lycopersici (strain 4287 / CBS 123668 / FGSC 9935 / NRRL 34936) TaxID=426428 RepID=A0A0J9V9Z3_FUSO4|nr:hypothetical protein FOXG_08837 [Fusarium oxysporum f. sp. lycopersici 4287]KNB07761.1 hypothetical protein FOXG_08837 [Fusarium oxysporum f. sp. lycopersici 4287]
MSSYKKKKSSSRKDFDAPLVQRSREEREDSSYFWINDCLPAATSTAGLGSHNASNTHTKASNKLPEEVRSVIRDPSIDIKDAGTGHHDNRMTKLPPGQFREPSLRRGYGMPYQTPKALESVSAQGTKQVGQCDAGTLESITEAPSSTLESQTSLSSSRQLQPPTNNETSNMYDLSQRKSIRGDLQPGGYRPIAMRHPETHGQETNKQQSSDIQIRGKVLRREKWKIVKGCVEKWCEPRRFKLAKDGPAASGSELVALLDQWNNLYATKFCRTNRNLLEAAGWRKIAERRQNSSPDGAPHTSSASHESAPRNETVEKELDFEGVIWPTVKDELMGFAESRILRWTEDKLRERMQALESLTRPPLLKANSSPESYQSYVRYLMNRTEAAGKNSTEIRKSEAIMSMALDLLPGLEERLRDQLERVVNKQEDCSEADMKNDQTNDDGDEEGNDDSGSAHENLEEACHDNDHKVQEPLEGNYDEKKVQTGLEEESEEDEDEDVDDFEEFYAEESEDDTYEDPDEADRLYRGSFIDSIEPRTPIATPRVMNQLRRFEQRYWDTLRAAEIEEETAADVIRSLDEEDREVVPRKRKASDSAGPSLAIRSKSMEQRLAAMGTPTPARKRQRFNEPRSSPASTACSSELPSLEDIFSSSIGRASSATTQPPADSSSPAIRVSKKKKKDERRARSRSKNKVSPELGDTATGAATVTKPEEMVGVSPGLFVTPDPVARQATSPFVFKKSASRHPVVEERFREETAEFQAMTPSARESMLYTALKEMRRRQG